MFVFAYRNLQSRPVRSLLALLGLTVAIMGMVGLFSVAEGIDYMVTSTFGKLSGVVAIQPGAPIPLFSRLPLSWGDEIEELEGVRTVQREIWARAHLIDGNMVISPPRFLFGIEIDAALAMKQSVYRDSLTDGRFLTLADRGTRNTVISQQIAEEYGKGIGESLRVDGSTFPIVGIYHCGSILLDVAIIADIGEIREVSRFDPASVSDFYIEMDEGVTEAELVDRVQNHFRGRKLEPWQPSTGEAMALGGGGENPLTNLARALDRALKSAVVPTAEAGDGSPADGARPGDTGPGEPSVEEEEVEAVLEVRSLSDWSERLNQFSQDLDIFLLLMTAIGVTIAVLSILNTMLMSVSERIIEFGILRANGWTTTDIMLLITWESGLLGVGGGVFGAMLGWLATQTVNWVWPTRIQLFASPGLLLFSLAFSTGLGVLGGLYPAIWAARMTPMDAIRRGR